MIDVLRQFETATLSDTLHLVRLLLDGNHPDFDTGYPECPEYMIQVLYEGLSPAAQARFSRAAFALLSQFAASDTQIAPNDHRACERLLALSSPVFTGPDQRSDSIELLFSMANNAALPDDLGVGALQGLLALGFRGTPGVWMRWYDAHQQLRLGPVMEGLAAIDPTAFFGFAATLPWDNTTREAMTTMLAALAHDHGSVVVGNCLRPFLGRFVPEARILFADLLELRGDYDQTADTVDGWIAVLQSAMAISPNLRQDIAGHLDRTTEPSTSRQLLARAYVELLSRSTDPTSRRVIEVFPLCPTTDAILITTTLLAQTLDPTFDINSLEGADCRAAILAAMNDAAPLLATLWIAGSENCNPDLAARITNTLLNALSAVGEQTQTLFLACKLLPEEDFVTATLHYLENPDCSHRHLPDVLAVRYDSGAARNLAAKVNAKVVNTHPNDPTKWGPARTLHLIMGYATSGVLTTGTDTFGLSAEASMIVQDGLVPRDGDQMIRTLLGWNS